MMRAILIFLAACSLAMAQGIPTYKPSQGQPSGSPLVNSKNLVLCMTFDDGGFKDWSRYNCTVAVSNNYPLTVPALMFQNQSWYNATNQGFWKTNFLDVWLPVNLLTNFSASVWIWPRSEGASGSGRILSRRSASGIEFELTMDDGAGAGVDPCVTFQSGTTVLTTDGNTIPTNAWSHIVITRTSIVKDQIRIYINGALLATNTNAVKPYTGLDTRLRIGNVYTLANYFHGAIGEVLIWQNYVLTQPEIDALYSDGMREPERKGVPIL